MLPIAPDTLLQERYHILNLLEDGGSGRIYLATDRERGETECAIEEIVPSSQFPTVAAKAKELFQQEIKLLDRLQHPQLPRFWGVFEDRDRLFLVRDYIPGQNYAQILDERRNLGTTFSESEVWQFLTKALSAIGYLHSQGVVHRNLAPANIICRDRDLLPVPISFGVVEEFARKLQADPNQQQLAVGQPGYAPPEQLQHGQVYPHSDLYALAVTSLVLLTGKEPSALFENNLPNWEWRKWTSISDEFANVLGRMLSLDPSHRYQSAVEVNRELQSLDISAIRPPQLDTALQSHPSTLPTVAVGGSPLPEVPTTRAAMTNIGGKSFWEKPQVFIPVGLLISLLAGLGSWFGVSHLLHRPATDPVATTPPKQIDFNNPTIPTDTSSPSPGGISGELIQPALDRSIVKEGTVDGTTPVKYRIAAVAGQNLDIQLIPPTSPTTDPSKPLAAADPARSTPNPIAPLDGSPDRSKPSPTNTNPPVSIPNGAPKTPQQVLMTILSPSGSAIDNQSDRVMGWRGQIPSDGEYTIELRPIKGLTGNSFPYKLSVTQVATTATPSPSPSITSTPAPDATPSPGSTSPSVSPSPSENGTSEIDSPSTPQPSNDSSIVAPAPIPIVVPSNNPNRSETPSRPRRRRRPQPEDSPAVKERQTESKEETPTPRRRRRNRVESNNDETPTRRRNRVESNNDETPAPRRRRRRVESNNDETPTPSRKQAESEPARPISVPKPNTDSGKSTNTPQPEPSIGIPVPPAKTTSPDRSESKQNASPVNSRDIDTD